MDAPAQDGQTSQVVSSHQCQSLLALAISDFIDVFCDLVEYHAANHMIYVAKRYPNLKKFILMYFGNLHTPMTINRNASLFAGCLNVSKSKYNKRINIDETNVYTILKLNIDTTQSLERVAEACLREILKKRLICADNVPITMDDCIILDIFRSNLTTFSNFHTDVEHSNFPDAFNVWYLIENNDVAGNMFLLQPSATHPRF